MLSFNYKVRQSKRAKRMHLAVYPGTFKKIEGSSIGANGFVNLNNSSYFDGKCAWVYCDSSVVLTVPYNQPLDGVEGFVKQKFSWIKKSLDYFRRIGFKKLEKPVRGEYKKYRAEALSLAKQKVEQWNNFYGFTINRVSVKNQKTRWGSCSKKGNLNFNYKIIKLREGLVDYLVVHELCHLQEFNHSRNFWQLVARSQPDYKKLRMELKAYGI